MLVLEAEGSQREMDVAKFIDLNAIPFNQDVEHRHRKSEAALKICPFAMHNLLEMIDQGEYRKDCLDNHA